MRAHAGHALPGVPDGEGVDATGRQRGVRIGDGATVGATALVTRDVPEAATILAPRSRTKVES